MKNHDNLIQKKKIKNEQEFRSSTNLFSLEIFPFHAFYKIII